MLAAACAEDPGLRRISPDGFFDPPRLTFAARVGHVQRETVTWTNAFVRTLEVMSLHFDPPLDVFEIRPHEPRPLTGRRVAPHRHLRADILFGPDETSTYETTLWLTTRELAIGLPVSGSGSVPAPPRLTGPARVAFTDAAVPGEVHTQSIEIQNAGEQTTRLVRARSEPPFSIALPDGRAVADAGPLRPGDRVRLDVRFAPRAEGVFENTVQLEAERAFPLEVAVNGFAHPAGDLVCSPGTLDLGAVVRGRSRSARVHCVAAGGRVTITDVGWAAPPDGPLVLRDISPVPPAHTDAFRFDVDLTARGLPALHRGTVEVAFGAGEPARIAVRGETVAPPPEEVALSVTASWAVDADVDLHLVQAGAEPYTFARDCHWGSKTLDWNQPGELADNPFLDRDARRGPGAETINLEKPRGGIYEVWVQFFGPAGAEPPDVSVDLRLDGGPPIVRARRLVGCGVSWHVGRVRFDVVPARFEPADTETDAFASFAFACER